MSKKLLFNNYTVNGLLPAQDGLVCWLDAFDLTTYSGGIEWNDRTGHNNGIVREDPNVVSVNNGILHAKSIVDIPNPTKGLTNYTVEIGYEDLKVGYWLGLWGNTSAKAGNTSDGNSFYQLNDTIGSYPLEKTTSNKTGITGGKNYITFSYYGSGLKIYHNGELLSTQENNISGILNTSNADYLCFMGRKPNSVSPTTSSGTDAKRAKWYYIRIYNKTLTDEEISNNYNYELSLQRGE